MEKYVPLNRPQVDLNPTGLLNDVEGPCEMEWRDYERFQEGFSIVKTFIENKYKGVTLSIHDEPHEKHLDIIMNHSSPYDYVGTFWKLKLDSKTKDVFEIDHIIQDVVRMFKIIGIDLENVFELGITGCTVTFNSTTVTLDPITDTDNMHSTVSRYGITSHLIKKYKREYLERISQNSQTNFEYVSTPKSTWFTSILSYF
jgi:hypothetical protein